MLDKSSPAYNKGRVWIHDNNNVATVQAFTLTAWQDLQKICYLEQMKLSLVVLFSSTLLVMQTGTIYTFSGLGRGSMQGLLLNFEVAWEELVVEVLSSSPKSISKKN